MWLILEIKFKNGLLLKENNPTKKKEKKHFFKKKLINFQKMKKNIKICSVFSIKLFYG
ncbi:MAG: hypothetical protein ACFS26_00075 [Candidatus Karelsulcia muelleri]